MQSVPDPLQWRPACSSRSFCTKRPQNITKCHVPSSSYFFPLPSFHSYRLTAPHCSSSSYNSSCSTSSFLLHICLSPSYSFLISLLFWFYIVLFIHIIYVLLLLPLLILILLCFFFSLFLNRFSSLFNFLLLLLLISILLLVLLFITFIILLY